MKTCTKCGEEKDSALFRGKRHKCKACEYLVNVQWVQENKKHRAASKLAWSRANRDKKAKHAANDRAKRKDAIQLQQRRWEARNRAHISAKAREWRLANPDKEKAKARRWQKSHPEMLVASSHRYQTRKTGAGGHYAPKDIRKIFAEQGGCCFYCGIKLERNFHRDHKIPVSRGGTSWPENMCCACPRCNIGKSDLTAEEFFALRAGAKRSDLLAKAS